MGRYPKAPGQTRRPERSHWRTLDAAPSADVPPLPDREDGEGWTGEAVRAWAEWWRSPMSTLWLDADADAVALRRAIRLVDDAQRGRRGVDGALVALLDRLGLTPAGRLRLQWQVGPEAGTAIVVALPARGDPRDSL